MRANLLTLGLGLALALAGNGAASAQNTAAGCSGFKWPVSREQTAFAASSVPPLVAGNPIPGVMEAVSLQLGEQSGASFPLPPSHQPKGSKPMAGVFPLAPIAVAGTYQFTLSDEAWIDLVQDGKVLKQVGYSGAKGCDGVRKSVRFKLQPGPATVMISDSAASTVKLDVVTPEF